MTIIEADTAMFGPYLRVKMKFIKIKWKQTAKDTVKNIKFIIFELNGARKI